jgi:hypothetical protein
VDTAVQVLITELRRHPQRSTVLKAMKDALARFDAPESEERDQIPVYLTEAVEICGVLALPSYSMSGVMDFLTAGFYSLYGLPKSHPRCPPADFP